MTPMGHSVRKTLLASVASVALLPSALTSDVRAATVMPTLRLIQATSDVTLLAFPGEGAYLDLGLYLAATDAPFEIRLTRPDYSQPIQVTQMLSTTSGG